MKFILPWSLICLVLCKPALAQDTALINCGQQEVTQQFFRQFPGFKKFHEQIELQLSDYRRKVNAGILPTQRVNAPVTLPIVVHIIHNNGAENISDAQVLAGIQHLNEAFANTGVYDPSSGVNTQIQFCLAQRDPSGNITNGITRTLSPHTVMNGPGFSSDDEVIKNLVRWNPSCYINIWLVREIPGTVTGYAYLPSAHGSSADGIVMEAHNFGSAPGNSVVIVHEMGHYLGLYHTFEGACKNDDCSVDGDRVCDTPPDQSTAYVTCNSTMNSCSTDALSGFNADVNDLLKDYMDYGNLGCMSVFTQGQTDRMHWFIQNVRKSLLNCKSCLPPCSAPVIAAFTPSATTIPVGTTVNFTNNSVNASGGYRWFLNDVLQSTATNYSNIFNYGGTYVVRLEALPGSPLCDSAVYTDTIHVTCPVTAAFTPLTVSADINQAINFSNSSTGATSYQWLVNGAVKSAGNNFSISFPSPGAYTVKLRALSNNCRDSISGTVFINPDPQAPVDTCSLKTFVEMIDGTGDVTAYDFIATPDGGHLIAASVDNQQATRADALLVKTNSNGQVQWSKTYGNAGSDLFFHVIATRNGDYVAVGSGQIKAGHRYDIYVVRVDPAGNLIWAKAFGAGTFGGEIARSVVETDDGSLVISAVYNAGPTASQPLFLKLDRNGNMIWNKLLVTSNYGWSGDILAQGDAVIGVGSVFKTGAGSTYYDGYIVKIRHSDGSLLWTRNVESESRSNRIWEIRSRNNELVYTMTNADWSPANNTPVIFKTDVDGNVTQARRYDLAGLISPPATMPSAITADGGSVMAVSHNNGLSACWAMAGPDGNMQWTRNYASLSYLNILRVVSDHNSHTVLASGRGDIQLIKMNVSGFVKNDPANDCGITDGAGNTVSIPVQSTLAGPNYWVSAAPTTLENLPVAPIVLSQALSSRQICLDSASCSFPIDSCELTSFVKNYSTADTGSQFYDLIETKDGNLLATGSLVVPSQNGLIVKMNTNGSVTWTKALDALNGLTIRSAINTSDNAYVFLGSHAASGTTLLKTDYAGNNIWKKDFVSTQPGYYASRIIEGNDGDYYILGENVVAPPIRHHTTVSRVTAAGTLVWSRTFLSPANVNIFANFITDDNDAVMISGQYWDLGAPSRTYGMVMRVSKTSAQLVWAKYYRTASNTLGFGQILRSGNNFIVNSYSPTAILKLDANGNIISEVALAGNGIANGQQLAIDRNADIIAVNTPITGLPHTMAVYKLDADFNIKWVRSYDQLPKNTSNAISAKNDNIFISSVVQSGLPKTTYIITKLDSLGLLSTCPPSTFAIQKSSVTYTPVDFINATSLYDITYNSNTIPVDISSPEMIVTNAACSKMDICSQLEITGMDTVCKLSDSFEFRAQRSIGCYNKVQWMIDTNFARVLSFTDSTIRIQFLKTGTVSLKGLIRLSCEILQDSLQIFISDAPDTLNLGPDIELCRISTWPLNARSGFRSYLWQDGSTDSTYTVIEPGLYYVTVTDYCGNQYRDSVNVMVSPEIPFDLGPDVSVCEHDTLTLTAPAGFTNYVWSPGYRMVDNYSSEIKVYPDRDTIYSVVAERSPGCLLTDSIKVTIRQAPAAFLADTARVCINQPVQLSASRDFVQYRWDHVQTTPAITVNRPGMHLLEVTDETGCSGIDTIYVLEKADCGKIIYFPNGFTPNNDRFNNQFKPIISGALAKYHLIIYNRWGQKVFETFDPARGWDGVFNGTRQTSNTYIWVCTYTFAGNDQAEKRERGMVTLIR